MTKAKRGATLIELIVAITMLLIVATPIYGAYVLNLRSSVLAHRLTGATITAQLKIEEMVGRAWIGDLQDGLSRPGVTPVIGWNQPFEFNGFFVRVVPELMPVTPPIPDGYPLLRFRVIVAETNNPADPGLITMEHIVNVSPGGF